MASDESLLRGKSMASASMFAAYLKTLSPEELQAALARFIPPNSTTDERVRIVEKLLQSPEGPAVREELGRWIVDRLVPVSALVPPKFSTWREPTRESMLFVISQLSVSRLAPKVVEQYELPLKTSVEVRLLKLIAKVPGLQKLGQVLARNRHLRRSVRIALAKLENGIRDVGISEIHAVVRKELGEKWEKFEVKIDRTLLSEASVSAVVRFSWWNAAKRRREKGVLKVLKPHIPECFAEDMKILQDLADFFGARSHEGFTSAVIPDTFSKIRQHLQHEVDFPGEQAALLEAAKQFKALRGVRIPKLIPELCTKNLTAMSEEEGVKVTTAAVHMTPKRRGQVAQQLVEALIAFPLLSRQPYALFHADPHAGNLLYNRKTRELVILDWALAERLSLEQRRRLTLLFLAVALRNPAAAAYQIQELSEQNSNRAMIREIVHGFMAEMPMAKMPRAIDAMSLLEQVALAGVRFPSSLVMFSKVLFTLDGILEDIRGNELTAEITIAQYLLRRWLRKPFSVRLPLNVRDWLGVECSVFLYGGRWGVRLEEMVKGLLFSGGRKKEAASETGEVNLRYKPHVRCVAGSNIGN